MLCINLRVVIIKNHNKKSFNWEFQVMKVSPFYSKIKGTRVYHNNDKCHLGDNINKKYKRTGTDKRRLCKECKELNKEGK